MAEGSEQADNEMAAKIAAEAVPDPGRQIYLNEAKTRIDAALGAEIGLAERLMWFWSNHFCISANKIQSMAGINRTRGRNENLAREVLELHTLGVRSGYTQDDVQVSVL